MQYIARPCTDSAEIVYTAIDHRTCWSTSQSSLIMARDLSKQASQAKIIRNASFRHCTCLRNERIALRAPGMRLAAYRPESLCACSVGRLKHPRVMAGAVEGDLFIGKKAQELRGLLKVCFYKLSRWCAKLTVFYRSSILWSMASSQTGTIWSESGIMSTLKSLEP